MSQIRRWLVLSICLAIALASSGCAAIEGAFSSPEASPSPSATPPVEARFVSQFTKDGTFQSHIDIDGVDFVYTIWPTKSTPRTNEWYPGGSKFFSFTLTAYDLDRDLRDKFATKRKVYLSNIRVSSITTTRSGQTESPYTLDARAERITFDPEPVRTRRGMLITSPKGAFELRNQEIGPLVPDTIGITLTFEATVAIQRSARSKKFDTELIRQEVPIAIFESDLPTQVAPIPVNAN